MHKNEPAGAYSQNGDLPGANPHSANPRRSRRVAPADCPLAAAFAAIGGKWKLTIVYWLSRDEHHFSGLLRRVAPISHKVLTEQLRELEADGLVLREVDGPVPAPVRYRLSPYGTTVLPLVEAARIWGVEHLRRSGGAGIPLACAMASASAIAPANATPSTAR
jgi:DNA-binding HxlR family transcriptional regulator